MARPCPCLAVLGLEGLFSSGGWDSEEERFLDSFSRRAELEAFLSTEWLGLDMPQLM
jgi:hypothetical protein